MVTALAVIARETPREIGDCVVLLNAGFTRAEALLYNALSGLAAVAGGEAGYFVVGPLEDLVSYLLENRVDALAPRIDARAGEVDAHCSLIRNGVLGVAVILNAGWLSHSSVVHCKRGECHSGKPA